MDLVSIRKVWSGEKSSGTAGPQRLIFKCKGGDAEFINPDDFS